MKAEKQIQIPATVRKTTDYYTCDLCGKKTGHEESGAANWHEEPTFSYETVTIRHKHGYAYPEGGSSETTEFHVCPECWESKILPVFSEAEPTITENDW